MSFTCGMNSETTQSKINLMALNKRELEDYFISIEEKPFRATQIIKWVHQAFWNTGGSYSRNFKRK